MVSISFQGSDAVVSISLSNVPKDITSVLDLAFKEIRTAADASLKSNAEIQAIADAYVAAKLAAKPIVSGLVDK